jgi:hypothetical protein
MYHVGVSEVSCIIELSGGSSRKMLGGPKLKENKKFKL